MIVPSADETETAPSSTSVTSTNSGVWAGSLQPAGTVTPASGDAAKPLSIEDFFVDVGLKAGALKALVEPGDPVTMARTTERAGDNEAYYRLNVEFHDRIVDYAENDRLRAMCEGLTKELGLYRHRSLIEGGGVHVSNREHRRILAALAARDPARAGAELESHTLAGKTRFLSTKPPA